MNQSINNMIADIKRNVLQTRQYIGKDQLSNKVMAAMQAVPREQFVPSNEKILAYADGPLAIGHGQTISQPFIVALMTDLLELDEPDTVLEIGTGSGYQTAVLAQLAKKVYSLEVIPELARCAEKNLQKLNYNNIEVRAGSGYKGWPEHAPYDAIIVTAAAPYIPPALIEQLKPGGKMVIPVGQPYGAQELFVISKNKDNKIDSRFILSVRFVPLVEDGSI